MNEREKNKPLRPDPNAPDRYFDDPVELVDHEELDYETRLAMLQKWLSRIADGDANASTRQDVEGAIVALQARAKTTDDAPKEAPETHNYGVVERSDLRRHAIHRLLEKARQILRR